MIKIFYQKSVQTLIALKKNKLLSISKTAKKTNTTYSHISVMIRRFEKQGLLTLTIGKDARSKVPTLTDKGDEIADLLIKLRELI